MRHPPCVSGKHHNSSLASKVIKLQCVCVCVRVISVCRHVYLYLQCRRTTPVRGNVVLHVRVCASVRMLAWLHAWAPACMWLQAVGKTVHCAISKLLLKYSWVASSVGCSRLSQVELIWTAQSVKMGPESSGERWLVEVSGLKPSQ